MTAQRAELAAAIMFGSDADLPQRSTAMQRGVRPETYLAAADAHLT
jgi:hypothetical protein